MPFGKPLIRYLQTYNFDFALLFLYWPCLSVFVFHFTINICIRIQLFTHTKSFQIDFGFLISFQHIFLSIGLFSKIALHLRSFMTFCRDEFLPCSSTDSFSPGCCSVVQHPLASLPLGTCYSQSCSKAPSHQVKPSQCSTPGGEGGREGRGRRERDEGRANGSCAVQDACISRQEREAQSTSTRLDPHAAKGRRSRGCLHASFQLARHLPGSHSTYLPSPVSIKRAFQAPTVGQAHSG